MALYDFRCENCGAIQEHIATPSAPTPTECVSQDCNAKVAGMHDEPAFERVEGIGRTGFSLKGSGWAKDGYR